MDDKLRLLMKCEGVNSAKLAEILEIQPSGISHIMSGRNKPSYDFLLKLLQRFPRISPDWLLLDQGPIYRETAESKRHSEQSELQFEENPATTASIDVPVVGPSRNDRHNVSDAEVPHSSEPVQEPRIGDSPTRMHGNESTAGAFKGDSPATPQPNPLHSGATNPVSPATWSDSTRVDKRTPSGSVIAEAEARSTAKMNDHHLPELDIDGNILPPWPFERHDVNTIMSGNYTADETFQIGVQPSSDQGNFRSPIHSDQSGDLNFTQPYAAVRDHHHASSICNSDHNQDPKTACTESRNHAPMPPFVPAVPLVTPAQTQPTAHASQTDSATQQPVIERVMVFYKDKTFVEYRPENT